MSVTDTVDDVPALGNLVSLRKIMKTQGLTSCNLTWNHKKEIDAITGGVRSSKRDWEEGREREMAGEIQVAGMGIHKGQELVSKQVENSSQCASKQR